MSGNPSDHPADVRQTTCCVVGAGPAGMVLSLLLARQGVPVTLLEAHHDFDRDFRGDTIHPSTLELLDQLGLARRLLQRPHGKLTTFTFVTPAGRFTAVDLKRLRSPFPFVAIMPQAEFLAFLAEEARKLPAFTLVLGANVQRLVEEGGIVRGVRYQGADSQEHEVRATLTVGCDGRFSRLRKLAGFEPVKSAPPMDVVWLRLPKTAADAKYDLAGKFYIGNQGHFAVIFDRPNDEWQIGYIILKGSFGELKSHGIDELRRGVAELFPPLADRVHLLTDFSQIAVLSVESSMVPRWHKPGLLLLGDAAHIMSPVGGVGIQYAVQDAVEAANQLAGPLKEGTLTEAHLEAVQKRREGAARRAQWMQGYLQKRIVAQALRPTKPFQMPLLMRLILGLPLLRNLPAQFIGRGFRTSHLTLATPAPKETTA
jgi:2-polyprenyl-6-methoxyphenol hydroxylase-like FAD-dependent oxidoreductase